MLPTPGAAKRVASGAPSADSVRPRTNDSKNASIVLSASLRM
jgi:hypothetical protein